LPASDVTPIAKLTAIEILDSRGRPTIQATCHLQSGHSGTASVPSGASTGRAEAVELRDGDPKRYRGFGCRRAVSQINEQVCFAARGKSFAGQAEFDRFLVELDGTPDKGRLGANGILAVSLAFARAVAAANALPLYLYFAGLLGRPIRTMPLLAINLFSGGKHAGGQVPIQDVLIVPAAARSVDEALSMMFEVYQCAAELVLGKYRMRALTADEGGLAPPFPSVESMFENALQAVELAGFRPGGDIRLGVDVASSHFYKEGFYQLDDSFLTSELMIETLVRWVTTYPIASVEDGLAEEDWNFWPQLRQSLSGKALTVGDDLLCTNPARIRRAVQLGAADCLLLKLNQIATISEAIEAYQLARGAGWWVTVSARSGETEDNWLADLAVGWSADQIKVGSITQSERLAKYNRLLEIERENALPMVNWSLPRAAARTAVE
jgi:enolase